MTTTCVIASYGYGHLAAHCIDTVISQTKPFEHIIFCDDGAGDCEILPFFYPEVEYVIREENLGVVANFNDLLDIYVETDRVMFLGADNWLRQDALEVLSPHKEDIVTYDIQMVGEFIRPRRAMTKRHGGYYWDRSEGHHGSMLYNAWMARDRGGYAAIAESGKTCEDQVLYCRMLDAGASRAHVPEPLLYYRRHRRNCHKLMGYDH